MTGSLGRHRTALAWAGVPVAVASCLVAGFWLTAAAVALAIVIWAGVRALLPRRRGDGAGVGLALAPTTVAAVAWAVACVLLLAGPAADAIHTAGALHPLHGAPALGLHRDRDAASSTLIDALVALAVVSSLLAIGAIGRPAAMGGDRSQEALERARAIAAEYGEDSISPFIVRPDKNFEFEAGGVLAYRVIGETAVVSGDPVGPEGSAKPLLEALLQHSHRAGIRVAVYGASAQHLETYRAFGLRAVCVGEEAVVDPAAFSLEGRPVRKLRQSVHRVERRGWRISVREGREIDARLEAEIDALERAWRSQRKRMLGFAMSMGEFDPGVRPGDVYVLAWSPDGRLHAAMRFLTYRDKLSLDTMRRVGETPNGLNETLVCHALEYARDREVAEVSLNYAGLAHLFRSSPSGGWLRRSLIQLALRPLRAHFQMDRLLAFNQKFSPSWRPRYLIYESRAALARTMFRVLQAEGYLPGAESGSRRRDGRPWPGRSSSASLQGRLRG